LEIGDFEQLYRYIFEVIEGTRVVSIECVNFLILPAISFVKARKRLVQEKISNFDCGNFLFFFPGMFKAY
jgi:hypothetical protein